VADDLLILLSDERGPDRAAVSQPIHQRGLVILAEGESVHL